MSSLEIKEDLTNSKPGLEREEMLAEILQREWAQDGHCSSWRKQEAGVEKDREPIS